MLCKAAVPIPDIFVFSICVYISGMEVRQDMLSSTHRTFAF